MVQLRFTFIMRLFSSLIQLLSFLLTSSIVACFLTMEVLVGWNKRLFTYPYLFAFCLWVALGVLITAEADFARGEQSKCYLDRLVSASLMCLCTFFTQVGFHCLGLWVMCSFLRNSANSSSCGIGAGRCFLAAILCISSSICSRSLNNGVSTRFINCHRMDAIRPFQAVRSSRYLFDEKSRTFPSGLPWVNVTIICHASASMEDHDDDASLSTSDFVLIY